ncbi:MAG: iron ABC transporter permease, partial [Pseudomonadota bacterium]
HLFDTILPVYATNTLGLMVLTGIMASLLGVGSAWVIAACDFPGRKIWSWLLVAPIAAPAYIIAYVYTDFLEFSGPLQSWMRASFGLSAGSYWFPEIRSLSGAALMMSLVLYPYVYLMARASFAAQSRSQLLAARTLGATPFRAFWQIALPSARPAIAGGLALVLMETLADFGVADYFAIPTFSTGIFRTWYALGDRQTALQFASIMLIFVVVLVVAEASSRRGKVVSQDRLGDWPPPFRFGRVHAVLANLACAIPVTLGFVLPVGLLVMNSISVGDQQSFTEIFQYAWNSFKAAGVTALLAAILALLLVYAHRQAKTGRRSDTATRSGIRFATLGYALPGALLAIGVLGPLGFVDQGLTRFARDTLGWQGGLLLSGSIIILTYALIVRFLTVSYNSLSGGMAKISENMDAAARTLGATPLRLIRRIHIPLLAPQLAVGGALVFIDVVRELPATLILRPLNFETLATRVYWLASDERLGEASTASLLIVLMGMASVVLINQAGNEAQS